MDHCALNVALYGNTSRWAMTERGARHCARSAAHFQIGPSLVDTAGNTLRFSIDERCNPLPRRLQGEVTIGLDSCSREVFALTHDAAHRWGPISPRARISVSLAEPRLGWEGWAYVDSNEGDEPIEKGFAAWDWSRAHLPDGSTAVLYEPRPPGVRATAQESALGSMHDSSLARTAGGRRSSELLALCFRTGEAAQRFTPGARQSLGRSAWRIAMHSYQEGAAPATLTRRLEDTPFYARSVVDTCLLGQEAEAMHETLDAGRFARHWVQSLLPWKMPRSA